MLLTIGCTANRHKIKHSLPVLNKKWELTNYENRKFDDLKIARKDAYKARIQNNWGIIDATGNWLFEPKADYISEYKNGYARVGKNNQWGLINEKGVIIIPIEHNFIGNVHERKVTVMNKNDEWGIMNLSSNWVIPPKFSPNFKKTNLYILETEYYGISSFSDGLVGVRKNDKWGFIDTLGRLIIPYQFDLINPFMEGVAAVSINEKMGFIDKKGNWVIKPKFDIHKSKEGYRDLTGYDNTSLAPFISYRLSDTKAICKESMIAVSKDNKWAFYDKKGNQITDFIYDNVKPFYNGIAPVKVNEGIRFIDKGGKYISEEVYDKVTGSVENNWIIVERDGLFGCLDEKGNITLEMVYDNISLFKYGKSRVEKNSQVGIIDIKGEWIIPLQDRNLFIFHKENTFIVEENNKYGIIDKNGIYLLKPQLESFGFFYNKVAPIRKRGKSGYINNKGEIVIKPIHNDVLSLVNVSDFKLFGTFHLGIKK